MDIYENSMNTIYLFKKKLFALDFCEVIVDLALSASYHPVIETLTSPSFYTITNQVEPVLKEITV